MKLLEQLSNADAIAAQEGEVRQILLKNMKTGSDEIFCDKLGSLIIKKQGLKNGPKIMFSAHLDEVGFVVKTISETGKIFVRNVGAVLPLAKFMQAVRITTANGKKIKGYLNSNFIEKETIEKIGERTYVDVGAKSEQEVKNLGIEIGNMVTFDTSFDYINSQTIFGKAFDDRIGCYIMSKVFENLKSVKHPNSVYFAATSSEEVGLRGSKTSANAINPDVAFVIDCCSSRDVFDSSNQNTRKIGDGMLLVYSDRGIECNKKLLSIVKQAANKLKINLQLDMIERGGTDAGQIQFNGDGVPTVVCCIPLRYGHCSHSIANKKDIQDAIKIYTEIFKSFDSKKLKDCISYL